MKNKELQSAIAAVVVGSCFSMPQELKAEWGVLSNKDARPPSAQSAAAGVSRRAHYVVKGGYAAGGVGMRNRGYGRIRITGIPADSKILRAFLYWDVLGPGESPSFAQGKFNGTPIQGALVGSGGDPCWGQAANFAYRADVTKLVTGNDTYILTGFASGDRSGKFPWDEPTTPIPPLAEGATLVVIYSNPKSPFMDIAVVEGSDLFIGPYTLTVDGFLASDPVKKATVTVFGADGQTVGPSCIAAEDTSFNGSVISGNYWNGAPNANQLWDTHTKDVTTKVKAGDNSATVDVTFPQGVCDCLVFVGAVVAVSAGDKDGDGLADAWEKNGYDADGDGVVDVDLPGMGAKVTHKDLFVEIDWMRTAGHSHKPKTTAINKIVNAFKNAPVPNPDGVNGINLHVDYGQGGLFNQGKGFPEQTILPGVISGDWSAFDAIKAVRFKKEREPIFHYAIFAHQIDAAGTSGISRGIPGSDFVVSLGKWTNQVGTVEEQAGTFMHELGHNINLHHGGGDDVNYKPNFLSIMSYAFQTRGLRKNLKDGTFDYSRFLLPALNEADLNERNGLNGGAVIGAYGTRYYCAGGAAKVVNKANRPIDWDCDGDKTETSVATDINKDATQTVLAGFQDWDNLDFHGGHIGTPVGATPEKTVQEFAPELTEELTVTQDSQIPPSPPGRVIQTLNSLEWIPVGLEIIKAYKIYQMGADGTLTLVRTVPSTPNIEATESTSVSLPRGPYVRYAVTSVDRYGNESEPQAAESADKW
ncbi:MAG: DUF3344 domain-containing protein [Gammaproteobacteria bacterium]